VWAQLPGGLRAEADAKVGRPLLRSSCRMCQMGADADTAALVWPNLRPGCLAWLELPPSAGERWFVDLCDVPASLRAGARQLCAVHIEHG
jgi:hypothetical protein